MDNVDSRHSGCEGSRIMIQGLPLYRRIRIGVKGDK
jgi:hypothetical protein